MPEYPGSRVVARQLLGGYSQAVDRFAAGVRTKDPDPGFFALFESLNWAIAVDDFVREVWVPNGKPLGRGWSDIAAGHGFVELLDATRYARNLVHHHWADALGDLFARVGTVLDPPRAEARGHQHRPDVPLM